MARYSVAHQTQGGRGNQLAAPGRLNCGVKEDTCSLASLREISPRHSVQKLRKQQEDDHHGQPG